jgi:tagaturonate reductase
MQYSSKMRMRNVPVLLQHYKEHTTPPPHFSLGFAAYLLFMRGVKKEQEHYKGEYRGQSYPINDDKAGYYFELWKDHKPEEVVHLALQNTTLWGEDLSLLPGFEASVRKDLDVLMSQGAVAALAPKLSSARL